jgi:hypothetical protein
MRGHAPGRAASWGTGRVRFVLALAFATGVAVACGEEDDGDGTVKPQDGGSGKGSGGSAAGGKAGSGGAASGGVGGSSTGGSSTGGSGTGGGGTGGEPIDGSEGGESGGGSGTGGSGTGGNSTGGSGTGGSGGTGTGGTGTGGTGTGGTGTGGTGTGGTGGGTTQCMAGTLLAELGKQRLLVGASMADATATSAPFDARYLYIAGGLFDGSAPCTSCATSCQAGGESCANSNPDGCAWWGCWQWDQVPPGAYARDFVAKVEADGQIPMFTSYQVLQASGASEGAAEVAATNNVAFMSRYLANWRFMLQQIGQKRALLHVEPDFWGYAEHVNEDPTQIPSAVASANAIDCSGRPNTIAGLGRCMIAMVRKYAPNARVGLHASAWGTNIDVALNSNPSFDVAGEARKLGRFLSAAGAGDGDFVVVEFSDRDAGYYTSIGQDRWLDATNATLPSFNQTFTWAKALAEQVGKPLVWWQIPLGNMGLPNVSGQWHDNRVDYLFSHMDQVARAHGAILAFGAGAGGQTTLETDGNNLVNKLKAYAAGGGQTPCP